MSNSKIEMFDTETHGTNEKEVSNVDSPQTETVQRLTFNIWLIFGGSLFFGLINGWIVGIVFALYTVILGDLNSFDLNGVPEVITVLFTILALPLFGKFSDIFGRGKALVVVFALLAIGNLIIGVGNSNFISYTVGSIINGIGDTGRDLLIPVVLAELLIIENRGFGFLLYWLPSFCSIFLAIPLIDPSKEMGWRWLYVIGAIGVVVSSIPFLIGLFREGKNKSQQGEAKKLSWDLMHEIDLIGLLLLVVSLALILIPFTIVVREPLGFESPTIISMLCVGVVVLIGFFVWEYKYCPKPLIPKRLFKNRNLMLIVFVKSFLKFESAINWQYFSSYLIISRDITETHAALLNRGFQVSWYITGFAAAFLLKKFKWTRSLIWIGCILNIVGIALTIPARHPGSSDAFVVIAEVLIGSGGGFIGCIVVVMYQSAVDFDDIATISYIVILIDQIVSSIGSAVATATWNGTLSKYLINNLPAEYVDQVPNLLSNLYLLRELPVETKEFWITALGDSQLVMCSLSLALACVGGLAALAIKPLKL